VRRRLILIALAAVVAAALLAGSAGASGRGPSHLLVYAQEWSLWPSRETLQSGHVAVQLWNRGQDQHDLRIRALRHGRMLGRTQGVAITNSGQISSATWSLPPGTYELYCAMPGHYALGMHTRLVVR
jgi:plastocyanin